jgi:hypothetical protein
LRRKKWVFYNFKKRKWLCYKEIKIFKKFVFWSYPPAHLIDFLGVTPVGTSTTPLEKENARF